ncbi:unnamed protein product [Caenorhabditis sp. 36 PRJEB53466]|nr:unnamed protein product [Caenorhabditis sp. 36 PRJEB53466]
MKIKPRTILLVFLFIKLCILFTVLQETVESMSSSDHPLLFNTNDIFLFDVMLGSISALFILVSLVLIVFFTIGHSRFRKPYMVIAFAINLIFVLPFFFSGVYLTFHDHQGLKISGRVIESFGKMHNFSKEFHAINPNYTSKSRNVTIPTRKITPEMLSSYEYVTHIQKRYCCCGMDGARYYGFNNKSTALKESIPFTSKLDLRCPLNSLFKNSTCIDSHLKGCDDRLKTVHPTRILMYSCVGSVFATLFAVLSPFIYSQFELDRRRARSEYIREWRRNLEQHITDHRIWTLRNGQRSEREAGEGAVSLVEEGADQPLVNENRSTPRV